MDKELLCYICGNLFTNPVLLPCGHSLCLCCAESHYRYCKDDYSQQPCKWIGTSCENSGNYRVKCPLCNFDFTLPHGGVYGFVKNEIIEKIIEKSCKGTMHEDFWCEFCGDGTVKASFMCKECEYWYCRECLDSMHQLRGPLAYHTITEPRKKTKRDSTVGQCDAHDEVMEFYCLSCKMSVCQSCLSDTHKDHGAENFRQYSKRLKTSIIAKLTLFTNSCNNAKESEEEHEQLFACVKLAASEAEAHIKRQTDKLMESIERRKEQFLHEIESEYVAASNKISTAAQECKTIADEGMSFAELVSLVLEDDDSLCFVQTAEPIIQRLEESLKSVNAVPKSDWSIVSKFNKLSVDVTAQLASVSHLNWLQVPDPPTFDKEGCYGRNCKLVLKWHPLDCQVDFYALEMKILGKEDAFTCIYKGRESSYTLTGIAYGETIIARIKAKNRAGTGMDSDEIVVSMPKGLTFSLVDEKAEVLQLKENGALFFDSGPKETSLLGDVDLYEGEHSWGFQLRKYDNHDVCIGIGIASCSIDFNMLPEHSNFRAIILYNSTEPLQRDKIEHSRFILAELWKSLEDLRVTLALDVTAQTLNVYINSLLIKEIDAGSASTFSGLDGIMKPALWIKGGGIEVAPLIGLPFPEIPGAPVIKTDTSKVSGTSLYLEWEIAKATDSVDFFVVEICTLHQKNACKKTAKFKEVFRGLRTNLELKDLPYNNKVMCRVFAVNFKGSNESSDVFEGQTVRGFQFELNRRSAHPDLRIINNSTMSLSSPVYTTIMSNVSISTGTHYWEVLIEQFESQSETAVIGIGIATKELQDPILGEDAFSYAIQIHQHPKVVCINNSNKILVKKSKLDAEKKIIGIHVNLDSNWMDVYFHGNLMAKRRKSRRTFKIEHATYFPAFSLYGTNTIVSLRCGVDFEERFRDD